MKFAGYYVDFSSPIVQENSSIIQENGIIVQENKTSDKNILDCLLLLDPRITPDVLEVIKKHPLFVATEHVRQGVTQDELSIHAEKKKECMAVLKSIYTRSTKKHLHVLGVIFINGEKLHIVMYNDSKVYPFQLKLDVLHGRFGKPIMLPPHCT